MADYALAVERTWSAGQAAYGWNLNPPRDPAGKPAERDRQHHCGEAVEDRRILRRTGDETLEARFTDVDLTHRRGEPAAVLDEERLGGEPPDRDARGERDPARREHTVGTRERRGQGKAV